MKAASAGLIALLNAAQQFVAADLYTWTLADGTVARYTSTDRDLTIGGVTWKAGGTTGNPMFSRSEVKNVLGIEVDELKVELTAGPTDLIAGIAWLPAITQGKLDGATLLLEQFISDAWSNTANGKLYLFSGRVAIIDADRGKAAIGVKSSLELLDLMLPRNTYMTGCWHTLYDAGCTLSKAALTVTGVVGSSFTVSAFASNRTEPDAYFALGVVKFTSGVNNGVVRRVTAYTRFSPGSDGLFTVVPPLPALPSAGDTFTAYPGCDKQQSTCLSKFNNLVNFGGHPYVPLPETVL